MGVTSVTGTGPGESHAIRRPELHSACGCSKIVPQKTPVPIKTGCSLTYKINCGKQYKYCNNKLVKVC